MLVAFLLTTLLMFTRNFESTLAVNEDESTGQPGSFASYNNESATWTLSLKIQKQIQLEDSETLLFRVNLISINEFGNSSTRFIYTDQYEKLQTENRLENISLSFDHCYTGQYKLEIYKCDGYSRCRETFYKGSLGRITTDLNPIDVNRMNIGVSLVQSLQGVVVEFQVDYNLTEHFIKFESFDVQLIPKDSRNSDVIYSITTEFNRVEFFNGTNNNCSVDFPTNTTIGCFDITPGEYTIKIQPRDSRCNYPKQVFLSLYSSCGRYTTKSVTIVPPFLVGDIVALDEYNESDQSSRSVLHYINYAISKAILAVRSLATVWHIVSP